MRLVTGQVCSAGSNANVATTGVTPVFPATTTVGSNLFAVIVNWRPAGGGVLTVPSGWVIAGSLQAFGNQRAYLYYYENAPAQTSFGAWKSTALKGAARIEVAMGEFANVNNSSSIDVTAQNTNTGTSTDSGTTGTTAQANEIFIAGIATASGNTHSAPTNSFTIAIQASNDGSSAMSVCLLYKVVSSTGTGNTGTTITSDNWGGNIGAFKGSAEPAGSTGNMFLVM